MSGMATRTTNPPPFAPLAERWRVFSLPFLGMMRKSFLVVLALSDEKREKRLKLLSI